MTTDDTQQNAPKILLTDTSRWGLAARLSIGLTRAGSAVYAICPDRHPLQKTRAVRQTFHYSGIHPTESLKKAIEAVQPAIVIPCDDRGVEHLHELYAEMRAAGEAGKHIIEVIERSLGAPESYPVVSSRYDLLQIAREEGLRVPDFIPIRTQEDLKTWQSQQSLPWVLKADGTWGGRGVKIAHTPEQARTFLGELTKLFGAGRVIKRYLVNRDSFWLRSWWRHTQPAVMAQAHIQGRPANCTVVSWQGKVLSIIGVEVVSADGMTGPASVVRVVDNPEMKLCAERLARRLNLSGFFGLDFMIEDGTNHTYLIEMNPRCTPPCHLQLGQGRDLVGSIYAQLSGEAYEATAPVTQNSMIAYFPQAWAYKSEYLQSSFQDVPVGEPGLVQELLQPWPNRSLLFRASNYLHEISVFASGLVAKKSPN